MRLARIVTVAGAALVAVGLLRVSAVNSEASQNAPTKVHLPDDAAGLDAIVQALIAAYDQADVVALGDWHGRINMDADLRLAARIRVLGGDPGPGDHRSRETAAVAVLGEQVLQKRGKALVIYGAAHFYRNFPTVMLPTMGDDIGLVRKL